MAKTVCQIVEDGGGCEKIAEASKHYGKRISADGVRKWSIVGIHERHWEMMMQLTGVTVQELYDANRALEKGATPSVGRKLQRSKRERRLAAA